MVRGAVLSDATEPWVLSAGRALGRVALATLLLITLGVLVGALSTALAFVACLVGGVLREDPGHAVSLRDLADLAAMVMPVGAFLGASCAPVAGWLFLRRVPLWRAALEPAAAVIGAVALCGPFGLQYAIPSAFGAFWLAAARLRWSHRHVPAPLASGGRTHSSGGSVAACPSVG